MPILCLCPVILYYRHILNSLTYFHFPAFFQGVREKADEDGSGWIEYKEFSKAIGIITFYEA